MDSFLERQVEQAALDSSGTFTMDLERALRHSQLVTQPHCYAVLLVGLAMLQGARHLDLRFSPGRTTVTFDGQSLDPKLLAGLAGAWLCSPQGGAAAYLARAVEAALVSGRGFVRVTSGLYWLEMRGSKCRTGEAEPEMAGTRLEISETMQRARLGEDPQMRPEVLVLRAYCRWAPLRIRVNDRELWFERQETHPAVGLTHARWATWPCQPSQQAPAVGEYAGLFWFTDEANRQSPVTLVENGISYGPVGLDLGLWGCHGVLMCGGLEKDLSLLRLRGFSQGPAVAGQLAQQLAKLCPAQRVEPEGSVLEAELSPAMSRATPRVLAAALAGEQAVILGEAYIKNWCLISGTLLGAWEVAVETSAHPVLAVHPSRPWAVGGGPEVVLLNLESRQELARWPEVTCASFQGSGHLLALGYGDGRLALHRLPSGRFLRQWQLGSAVQALEWHPHGQWLVAVGRESAKLFTDEGQPLAVYRGRADTLDFSPGGDLLAIGSTLYRCPSQQVHWDRRPLPPFRKLRFLHAGEAFVGLHDGMEVRCSRDGTLLWKRESCVDIVVSADRRLLGLQLDDRVEIVSWNGVVHHRGPLESLLDLDSRWLLGAGQGMEWTNGRRLTLGSPAGFLRRLNWHPRALVAEGDGCAYRLDLDGCQGRCGVLAATHDRLADAEGVTDWHGQRLLALPLTAEVWLAQHTLLSGGRLYGLPGGELLTEGETVALTETLAAVGSKSGVELIEMATGRRQRVTSVRAAQLALSGCGNYLALQSKGSPRLEVWQTAPLRRLFAETEVTGPWALSEDGEVLAVANPVRLISTRRPTNRRGFNTRKASALFLHSQHLVLATTEGTFLYRYDMKNGEREEVARLAPSPWREVVFRPDGQFLAGLDRESQLHFCRLDSGREMAQLSPLQNGHWISGGNLKIAFE